MLLIGAVAIAIAYSWPRDESASTGGAAPRYRFDLRELLSGPPDGLRRAAADVALEFPRDHGPHPDYRSGWWYFTGNLADANGRRFGFQLTFFRFTLTPRAPVRRSAWGSDQIYMGHFALTDPQTGRFVWDERLSRASLLLAGARGEPFGVWVEDWRAGSISQSLFPLSLTARTGRHALALTVHAGKRRVLHGEGGLSRKGAAPGNASHYYSYTRLPAEGVVELEGELHAVAGDVWWDREWSTSALEANQVGWDWFALQLDDGRDLMFYLIRGKEGRPDPHSAGSLVGVGGNVRVLGLDDVLVEVTGEWESEHTGVRYPARWRLRVPEAALDLEIEPLIPAQELRASVRYWEGAVTITKRSPPSTSSAIPRVVGRGYVELVGYPPGGRPRGEDNP